MPILGKMSVGVFTHAVTPKMTIPSPSVLHFRGGRKTISKDVYPTMDSFFADTAEAYRRAVGAFYDAGCRYLQLDDTVWAYLCSPKERQAVKDRGEDPDALPTIYRDMIQLAIKDRPHDLIVTTHVCRGNFRFLPRPAGSRLSTVSSIMG